MTKNTLPWFENAAMVTHEYPRVGGGRVSAVVWWGGDLWRWRLVKGNGHWFGGLPTMTGFDSSREAVVSAERYLRERIDPDACPDASAPPVPDWVSR